MNTDDQAAGKLDGTRVTLRQADAQSLPFEDASFDAMACQFGVMFFPDKVAAFAEAHRLLRPGSRFVFSVWDRLEENPIGAAVHGAMAEAFPDDPPQFLARAPYGYHDTGRIQRELREAGFTAVDTETVSLHARAPSADAAARGLCQGSPLRVEIEARDPHRLEDVTKLAAEAVARAFGHEDIAGRMQAHVITARK